MSDNYYKLYLRMRRLPRYLMAYYNDTEIGHTPHPKKLRLRQIGKYKVYEKRRRHEMMRQQHDDKRIS